MPIEPENFYAAIERAETHNAFITVNRGLTASADGDGELAGMYIAVKDNIHVAGLPNTAGTELLKDFIPT